MCLLPAGEKPDRHALEEKAEQWRLRPCFARDEVNITKLGASIRVLQFERMFTALDVDAEEAEGMIAFVSDWLELDAYDDWVRHDSETVRLFHNLYNHSMLIQLLSFHSYRPFCRS